MNAPVKTEAVFYAIPNAFSASGYICEKNGPLGLLRAQWSKTFADMEDTIRLEMEEEKYRRRSKSDQEAAEKRKRAQDLGRQTIAARAEMMRMERGQMVIEAIKGGANTATEIRALLGFSGNIFDKTINDLKERGLVYQWAQRNPTNTGTRFIYGVHE